jgi:beta-aspartyl-peptidase (threonine type)
MGHLEFSELEITALGDEAALILGRWHLDRESGPVGGVFTLVARRFPEGWRIIHDHTSEVVTGKKTE